jgi:L-lysine exporter family protein LysE/ArgO
MNAYALGTGFALGATLLVAIGAQNAFVLRQGLRREHVLAVVCACSLFDWLLMAAGIGGLGAAVRSRPVLAGWFSAGGAAFLFGYAAFAWSRALKPGSLQPQLAAPALSRRTALAQSAAFTFLNPHVYLDTVVLIGSVGARQPPGTLGSFFVGAGCASTVWFFALGYGARLLAPLFAQPAAWRVLDAAVGLIMFALAVSLLQGFLHGAAA